MALCREFKYLAEVLGTNQGISANWTKHSTCKVNALGTYILSVSPRKACFLRYAGCYLRRPPIAEDRIISVTDDHVEFWTNDLKLKKWVNIKVSVLDSFLRC